MQPVRVGIIGRGFGSRVVAPAFEATEGCEVVEVVTPRDGDAVAALCTRKDVDLVAVHSPPFMHLDHVRLAIDAGHAVLCDKPFGRNAGEADQMLALARDAGTLNFLNFELRYDPARERLHELIGQGAVGVPEHFFCTTFLSGARVPLMKFGWLFDAALGGGWIGAWGSHTIDFFRWSFGEVEAASAELRIAVGERPDPDGHLHRCTAEDGFTATMRSSRGVTAAIDSSFAATANLPGQTVVIGPEGALEVDAENRIVLRRSTGEREEIETGPRGPAGAMQRWVAIIRDCIRNSETHAGIPTFVDGLACAQVMDLMRGGAGNGDAGSPGAGEWAASGRTATSSR